MTIRHRITLLVILMFVALSAIGGYAVYQTRHSAAEVKQVTEGVVPSALASADLVSQVKDVQLAIMTLVYRLRLFGHAFAAQAASFISWS
jgi:two-component system chemotaxis sensor kinase CheA